MGLIRFVLALSVLFAHTGLPIGVGGRNAVQAFFVISGFLISYILTSSGGYSRIPSFLINRALRIFPIYFVALTCALSVAIVLKLFAHQSTAIDTISQLPLPLSALLVLANVIIIGQDQALFMNIQSGVIHWNGEFQNSDTPIYTGFLIPQAWSLSLELLFYIAIPFFIKKRPLIIVIFLSSILARLFLIAFGIGLNDPWSYRFFPLELGTFLAGVLVQQYWQPAYQKISTKLPDWSKLLATILLGVFGLAFQFNVSELTRSLFFFAALLLLLPLLFEFQSKNRIDKWLADQSYPIYVWHILIVTVVINFLAVIHLSINTSEKAMIILGLTIIASVATNRFLGKPIEQLRDRIRSQTK